MLQKFFRLGLAASLLIFLRVAPTPLYAEPRDLQAMTRFQEVTQIAGIPQSVTPTYGMAWGDFDDDGWTDVFIGHHAQPPLLLRNQHDGTFADVTEAAGINLLTDRHGCAWGDADNDSKIDLYCSAGAEHGLGSKPNQLWRNNGDGTFQEVAAARGAADGPGRGRSVNWLDYDGDGLLDIFVGNTISNGLGEPSRLYRNNGSAFNNIAAQVGLSKTLSVVTSALTDYNQDNRWDLAIAPGKDLTLFKHKANGMLRAVGPLKTGLYAPWVHALAWGDYDNDGYADLYAAALNGSSKLFHNNSNGTFSDVTATAKLIPVNRFPEASAVWADFDNDGDLDLFVVRQGTTAALNAPDILWRNNGNGTFTDVTTRAQVAGPATGQGDAAAVADFDNDGFLDVLVTNGAGPKGGANLYHNLGNGNHWLSIHLRGAHSNALAIGSKIWLTVNGKTQYREYVYGSSGRGQSQINAHFGLGQATVVDTLKIQWHNNQIQEWTGIDADQILALQQP